jgi:ATP-dependent protease ClpP protease subunit
MAAAYSRSFCSVPVLLKAKTRQRSHHDSHQPLGGVQGLAADIEIQAKEICLSRRASTNTWWSTAGSQKKKRLKIPTVISS